MRRVLLAASVTVAAIASASAQTVSIRRATPATTVGVAVPRNTIDVALIPAPPIAFPNPTDSNSPSFWLGGTFWQMNSAPRPRRSSGTSVETLVDAPDIAPGRNLVYLDDIHAEAWLESVIVDGDTSGRLYGYYHAEFNPMCPQPSLAYPAIGAVFSDTNGATWHDLGLVLTAVPGTITCDTEHPATAGGVGDFSVILDNNTNPAEHYLYFFFSNYSGGVEDQGVSFARMLWIDRDRPIDSQTGRSRVFKWWRGMWTEPGLGGMSTPLVDDARKVTWKSLKNNGYWGPSVHWNVDLQKFVILMNRSKGDNYLAEGIYMTYTTDLSNPRSWALPKKFADGQDKFVEGQTRLWYPQVVGSPAIHGTDKLAGRVARYFNFGTSNSLIVFTERKQ